MKHPLTEALELYKHLLTKYHKTLDLMSDRALEGIDEKIADSLQYVRMLETVAGHASALVDVGSGNGLPSIPMALALPHWKFHLIERRQRRASFLNIVKSQLGLDNIKVHKDDVKNVAGVRVSVVTALAVGSLVKIYCLTHHLHVNTVVLLSRKGEHFETEIDALEVMLSRKVDRLETTPLGSHGTLVAVVVAGGLACRSSE